MSGSDPVDTNARALPRCCADWRRTAQRPIIVELPDRFARDLAVQLAGHDMLMASRHRDHSCIRTTFHQGHAHRGVGTPGAGGYRSSSLRRPAPLRSWQRLGSASVEREGRCEGRKPFSETRPEVVVLACKLRRRRLKGGQLSLRGVSKELAARGYLNERAKPYAAKSCSEHVALVGRKKGYLSLVTAPGWATVPRPQYGQLFLRPQYWDRLQA